ncbi:MAG: hypothetical protein IH801_04150 [Nitrospinae bacterium]|nr:hypothetical protein [Nitrospinota bacterium]
MRGRTNLRHPTIGRIRRAASTLAAGLILSGCASSKPVSFRGPTDIRSVEVALADLPPMEAYYHRRHPPPPGLLGMLGATPYTFTGLTIWVMESDGGAADPAPCR